MEFKSFTRRYVDKSNTTGFQFEFWCDLCTSSHMTTFQYDPMGVAASLLTAASWLVRGGVKYGAASQQLNQLLRGKSWDDAYAKAVEEAKKLFTQCSRCRRWVCADHCWAKDAKLCRGCVPDLAKESVAMKAQAGKFQVFGNAMASDQTGGRDMSAPQMMHCLHCGRANVGGNFCADCGKPMISEIPCQGCEASWAVHLNYQHCPSCGAKMSKEAIAKNLTAPGREESAKQQEASAKQEPVQRGTAPSHAETVGKAESQSREELEQNAQAGKAGVSKASEPQPKSATKAAAKKVRKSGNNRGAQSSSKSSPTAASKARKASAPQSKRKSKS